MAIIGMTGTHALGKTTAGKRYVEKYPRMKAQSEIRGLEKAKETFVQDKRDTTQVWLLESYRITHLKYFLTKEPVIVVTCPWKCLEQNLRARCEAKGKKFNKDYWSTRKLEYEAERYHLGWAIRNLYPDQYKHFVIEDQAKDWPAVDEYFGSLYRKLHNQIVREKLREGKK